MRWNSKAARLIALGAVAATALAACSGSSGGNKGSKATTDSQSKSATTASAPNSSGKGFNAAVNGKANASTKAGGTLNLLANGDCDSWDPARSYYGWCWNMERLYSRTMMGYDLSTNSAGKLVPDMATAPGTHNADFTQWTYHLKPGLKWSDGTPITSADFKYAIERDFATDVINGGATSYFIDTIKAPAGYAGVYKSGPLASILTPNATTITYTLAKPYASFDNLMGLAASAPIPANVEGGPKYKGATYTLHPVSSGPFMIESYTPNKQITFTRNPNWSQSTDTIRKPLVDKVVMTIDTNASDIDQKLQSGQGDARADNGVQQAFQAQILTNPTLKADSDNPVDGSTRYLSVQQTVIPNASCRMAIFYAINKSDLQKAWGGTIGGQIANTMTPPEIQGYSATANLYPVGADNTGDLTKAKAALTACGKPNGFSTKMAYATGSQRAVDIFTATQTALARVGIKVTAATADQSSYYSNFVGSPKNIVSQGLGIAEAGWGPDFPAPLGFWNSIANGANILPTGNSNYPSLNDPAVNKVLAAVTAGTATTADLIGMDAQIMKDAVYLPYLYDHTLYYRNPRLTNATANIAQAFGIYDFVNAGVGG
jgi:peptide/nickel transport system substrate-binding protein